jgi:peptidoglycan/LPS O-acetylase OafA/YrhL
VITPRIIDAVSSAPDRHHIRQDIQGLRGVAVLLVMIYHSEFALPGGFIGVDMFFVISGYVIAAMISRELAASGSFSVIQFFFRRIRRLVPALIAMTLVVASLSLVVLSPYGEIKQSMKTAIAGQLFAGNMHLFAMNAYDALKYSPFRHLWSLGVEEQFYVLVPVAVVALARMTDARRRRRLTSFSLIGSILGSFAVGQMLLSGFEFGLDDARLPDGLTERLASVGFLAGSSWPVKFAFFGAPGRMWEILVGVAVALVPRPPRWRGPLRVAVRLSALGVIVISAGILDSSSTFPGVAAMPTVVATAALVALGSHSRDVIARLLTSRPLCWIGDRSYPLYLWHWPMIVIARLWAPDFRGGALLAVLASVIPAMLSHRFVETPVRRIPVGRLFLMAPLGLVATIGVCVGVWRAAETGLGVPVMGSKSNFASDAGCANAEEVVHTIDGCTFGPSEPRFHAVLYGDSTARSISGGVWNAVNGLGGSLGISVDGGCKFRTRPEPGDDTCNRANNRRWDYLETRRVDVVIVNNRQDREGCELQPLTWRDIMRVAPSTRAVNVDSTAYLTELRLIVDQLSGLGIPMIVVEQFPWCGPSRPSVLRPQPESLNRREVSDSARDRFFVEQRRIVRADADNEVVSTATALCVGDRCPYFRDGVPLFADPAHLTDAGSQLLVPALSDAIRRSVRLAD